jgi:hypothetical protein
MEWLCVPAFEVRLNFAGSETAVLVVCRAFRAIQGYEISMQTALSNMTISLLPSFARTFPMFTHRWFPHTSENDKGLEN